MDSRNHLRDAEVFLFFAASLLLDLRALIKSAIGVIIGIARAEGVLE